MADGQDQSLYQGTGICKQFFSRLMKNIFTQARVGYEMVPDRSKELGTVEKAVPSNYSHLSVKDCNDNF